MSRKLSSVTVGVASESLGDRARAGRGLDMDFPVVTDTGTKVTSRDAVALGSTEEMVLLVHTVRQFVKDAGGEHVVALRDPSGLNRPGSWIIRWNLGPSAETVAEQFKVSENEDGLSLIPGWLNLRCDTNFDIRWTTSF